MTTQRLPRLRDFQPHLTEAALPRAVGRLVKPASLNKTEARYWDRLISLRAAGHILWFDAHRLTFLLGPDCRYTPDFLVLDAQGGLECREIKGPFIRTGDDGMVKLRMAARTFPFLQWRLCHEQRDKSWVETEVVP